MNTRIFNIELDWETEKEKLTTQDIKELQQIKKIIYYEEKQHEVIPLL